ncbi:MAG: RluA family pseudouridine synthase [Ruminococcaceae bacterium]|nr:RluA family pseudouridine synthase [Oscillospiraceae bacterium]
MSDFQEKDIFEYVAEQDDVGKRTDAVLTEKCSHLLPGSSRSYIQKLIENGGVLLDGVPVKTKYKVKPGDCFTLEIPEVRELTVEPENIPIDVVYEDSDIIVINKARGMVVHPADGNYTGTLVNALLYHCKDLSDINGVRRPGIVHRIDKDTTGLLVVAKNNKAHTFLADEIKYHKVSRIYTALTEGLFEENSGMVNAPVGRHPVDRKKMAVNTKNGKEAITHFTVIERFENTTLVKCRLETGRTHQIRVHMAYIGHPVAGDPVYGRKNNRGLSGQALHAGELTLTHPSTGESMTFTAPLPEDFQNLLNVLK